MVKRRGRLPAAMRRSDMIHARATPSEREALKEMAKNADMTVSAFVVAACFAFAGKGVEDLVALDASRVTHGRIPEDPDAQDVETEDKPEDKTLGRMPK